MTIAAEQGWYPLTSSVWSRTRTGQEAITPVPAPPAPPATPTPPTPPTPAPDIHVGKNGRIHGVDGMLDQIAQALAKHAGPMLVRDVLPAVQKDQGMQSRLGQAAGNAMAATLRPWIIVGAGALGVLAVVEVLRYRSRK